MRSRPLCLPLFSLFLISCGGSSSSAAAPVVTATNQSPSFVSANAVDVVENSAGTIYTAQATDPENAAITFSLVTGQGDNSRFTLNGASGALSFITPPDFEAPDDANTDNVYDLVIRAADSQGATTDLELTLTVLDQTQDIAVRLIGQNFDRPLFITELPDGSGRLVIVEQAGKLKLLNPDTGAVSDMLDITSSVNSRANEQGLLGLAFAPDYDVSGLIYVNAINADGDTEIRRYSTVSERTDLINPLSEDVILTIAQPFSNHNAGWIGFDANGFLLVPTGDGGSGGDPLNNAQNTQSLLGKVLRLDVNGDDFPADDTRDYAIPSGNSFTSLADGLPEIFAVGLRNPYRASFDPVTGDLLMGDVGQNAIEEISRLPIDDSSLNFGWNVVEGTQDFNGPSQPDFTPPVAEYSHGTGPREGSSVTGGHIYAGPVEALQNTYIFADFVSANIWGIPAEDLVNGQTVDSADFDILTLDFTPDQEVIDNVASFGTDAAQNLYILDFDGDIFKLDAAEE